MAENISTSGTSIESTTTTAVNSSSLETSSALDGSSGVPVVVYVLLGAGAAAPVVLLLVTAAVLRSRRAARHAARRRVAYNSAPVVRAWNSPVADGTPKPTGALAVRNLDCPQGSGVAAGTLSELAVREFFDVPAALSVSVDLDVEGRRSSATSPAGTAESSTPGGGSETSGEMERRAGDLLALIGQAFSVTTKNCPQIAAAVPSSSDVGAPPSTAEPTATADSCCGTVEVGLLKFNHCNNFLNRLLFKDIY